MATHSRRSMIQLGGAALAVKSPELPLKVVGNIKPRPSSAIRASAISLGFETLDRRMFDPERTYGLLGQSGVKWARRQTGWSRTETVKGQYDFRWLDKVVDSVRRQGVQPWFSLRNEPLAGLVLFRMREREDLRRAAAHLRLAQRRRGVFQTPAPPANIGASGNNAERAVVRTTAGFFPDRPGAGCPEGGRGRQCAQPPCAIREHGIDVGVFSGGRSSFALSALVCVFLPPTSLRRCPTLARHGGINRVAGQRRLAPGG